MNLGRAIKELRQQKGLNQADFAVQCGLSQSYLSSIENGIKEPTITILKRIAESLAIPMPVMVFLSLDENDIAESKREAYKMLEPLIAGLFKDIFISK